MNNQDKIVYIAEGSEKTYHYNPTCGGHNMEFEATESEAKQYGYSPCSRCCRITQSTQIPAVSQPTGTDYRHRCPECGGTDIKIEVYQEDAGSTIVSNTTHSGRGKERGLFVVKQKTSDRQRTVENVTTNTAYKSVMVCQHCGHVWTKKEGQKTRAPREVNPNAVPFWQQKWVFILTAIFFPPVALVFIWTLKKNKWDQQKKIKWSAIIGIWAVIWFILMLTSGEPVDQSEIDTVSSFISNNIFNY